MQNDPKNRPEAIDDDALEAVSAGAFVSSYSSMGAGADGAASKGELSISDDLTIDGPGAKE